MTNILLKIKLSFFKSIHVAVILIILLLISNIHANFIVNTVISLERNIRLINLTLLMIVLEIIFLTLRYWVDLELWELEHDKKIEYEKEE